MPIVSSNRVTGGPPPKIVITCRTPEWDSDPDRIRANQRHYVEVLRGAGAEPILLNDSSTGDERGTAFAEMDGLLLSGGGDLDPALYGQPIDGSRGLEPERDQLEKAAWDAAKAGHKPVLGICRGLQALNVFSGGSLVQHLEGHRTMQRTVPAMHPLRLHPGSRLARILRPSDPAGGMVRVNSYHHQGVRAADLAPGLLVAGTSPHRDGELVEALESADPDEFVIGVQCHPERADSTPPEFARLWTVFVDACRPGNRPLGQARPMETALPSSSPRRAAAEP